MVQYFKYPMPLLKATKGTVGGESRNSNDYQRALHIIRQRIIPENTDDKRGTVQTIAGLPVGRIARGPAVFWWGTFGI